jgi:preprotein translocase subunit YajC
MRALFATLLGLAPLSAFAQAADAAAVTPPSPMANLLPLLLILVVFYIALIRPQQKRMKEHQATLSALKKGDEVVTAGGIIGKISKIADGEKTIKVEIASGVEVSVLKATVTGLVNVPPAVVVEKKADKKKSGSNKNDNAVPSRDSVANDN